ncbi:hypothetical protein [Actinomadura madurae]|uniref:hypothetical protein n=1 Tax=Actinomadura madurae TaxID=1993 RepID=UPI0020D213C4|nr:hypothetical protein [Actinomadura madurae]MCQ0016277.1 hypothetical protein [Actinomadura madurae]
MSGLPARSPLILPWATLKLAGRFVLPLALWFTVGELLRYGAMYAGYRLGTMKGVAATLAPIVTVGLLVVITLAVTVLMVHCVREGLDVVHARDAGGGLTPWAVGNEESVIGAIGRAALPFVIFYLAWGRHGEDAREFAGQAASRGFAEGGIEGQIQGAGLLLSMEKHLGLAIGLTAGLFVLKVLAEWRLEPRLPRAVGALVAFLEINFALFGIFTIDHLRGKGVDWFTGRQVWAWVNDAAGPALGLWPPFKDAVLGALILLVIAGVVLGLDAGDERVVLGGSRAARRLAAAGRGRPGGQPAGAAHPRVPRDVAAGLVRAAARPPVRADAVRRVLPAVHRPARGGGRVAPAGVRAHRPARGDVVDPGAPVRRVRDGPGVRGPADLPARGGVQPGDGAGQRENRSETCGSPVFRDVFGARISSSSESAMERGTVPLTVTPMATPALGSPVRCPSADHSRPWPSRSR